jgi:actin-like protein 6A
MLSGTNYIPGGDDVNALVLDVGSFQFRAGFAGEDAPRIMESSTFRMVDTEDVDMNSDKRKAPSPVNYLSAPVNYLSAAQKGFMKSAVSLDKKSGCVDIDPDMLSHVINFSFNNIAKGFQVAMPESPLIMTEPNRTNSKYRKICFETAFESCDFLATSLLRRATGSAFAVGKQSGLVLDIGSSMTSVVPVFDGFVLQKPTCEFPGIGGDLLDQIMDELLKKKRISIQPYYRNTAVVSPHYLSASRLAVVRELKHELCRMSSTSLSGVPGYTNWSLNIAPEGQTSTTLPDGTCVDLAPFNHVIPELLFDPNPVQSIPQLSSSMNGFHGVGVSVLETISNCDVDARKAVSSDVILTGGSSLFGGMPERLLKFLSSPDKQSSIGNPLIPIPKPKVTASPVSLDRMSSSWLGCSIIGSCATFQQLWVSKKQYQEDGFDRVVSRQLFW